MQPNIDRCVTRTDLIRDKTIQMSMVA